MYFPTSAARQLSSVPPLPLSSEHVFAIVPSPRKTLFASLTRSGLTLWRVRPSGVLAHLERTTTSIAEHGENLRLHWSPEGQRIIVQIVPCPGYARVQCERAAYQSPPLAPNAARHFLPGAGEALPFQSLCLRMEGVIRIDGSLLSVSPRKDWIVFSTANPPAVQRVPWPDTSGEGGSKGDYDTWVMNDEEFPWLVDADVSVCEISFHRQTGFETWITSDGRAYLVQLVEDHESQLGAPSASDASADDERVQIGPIPHTRQSSESSDSASPIQWHGTCIHHVDPPRWVQKRKQVDPGDLASYSYTEPKRAMTVSLNPKFSMLAIGTYNGAVEFASFPSLEGIVPTPQVLQIPNMYARAGTGSVCTMEWSSDGYVLAVGWEKGWAVWSVGGRCLAWGFGVEYEVDEERFQDAFMYGVRSLFWAPGNFELFMLAQSSPNKPDGQMFVLPFAKSATTGQQSPDNTQYGFLQMDDRVLVYRGADQPDMSVINPESDVWQHIKVPQTYMSAHWPIRYSSLSTDGRLVAIAGRRGLVHYSTTSGRWKMFADERQEQAFTVKGGLLWFHHVLIAAVEVAGGYQVRLYSRDLELSNQNVLHREMMTCPIVILSLVDNSLLVYTADNTLHHYLIVPTADSIRLHLCGSITFDGVIAVPNAVRALSWMIPAAQKQLGDPAEDLSVATVLMIVGGKLVLLRPRKSEEGEVRYDMQILADRIEFCWIHLRGIGTLENSLWGYDGQGIRVWLNALAIEAVPPPAEEGGMVLDYVKESVNIPLDFYPLSVLMDKGIIIGVEVEAATRTSLSFTMFRHVTSSHLFLHHILQSHLENAQGKEAVVFASHYQHLVYFAHALEVLLHAVVEEDAQTGSESTPAGTPKNGLLTTSIEFLDHFDDALDVVVGCARKIEMTRWPRLFNIVGNPKILFESCLSSGRLKTAGSYLLVLHGLEQLDGMNDDANRLLRSAVAAQDWQLCRDILRFLHSIDDTGAALQAALVETQIVSPEGSQLGQLPPELNGNGVQVQNGNGSAH
ncbi:RIC1-domain-containing protein [Epithele typhae]|uniref:RIC1-domain-containing protein n=1 Tax=Epithele typhae TaxID=378194 RepID=UPI002007AD15|nr:RIC1-domain-containing protein [Epithele typhae]KAH9895558.1 RIC1-domain-containing protein [Epithele typhae]